MLLPLRPEHFGTLHEPLWSLLYRYWFWGWLFLAVTQSDWYHRASALRHNVRQRVHLPVYMRRWLLAGAAWMALGWFLETRLPLSLPMAIAYTAAVLSAVVLFVTVTGWALLHARE